MGKIRVSSLAAKMGLPSQDLIFKLKSIGVRIEGDDAEIDTDIIEAILTGKSMQQPREVIIRDGEAAPAQARRTPPRRMPNAPPRPHRRRPMVQRVEPRIRTLPTRQQPATTTPPATDPVTTSATASPTSPAPPAAIETAAESPAAGAQAAAATPAATATPSTEGTSPEALPDTPRGVRTSPPPEDRRPAEKKAKRPRPSGQRVTQQELRSYRGSVREIERERERIEIELTGSSRGRRRAERRAEPDGEEILAFKGDRPEGQVAISEGMTVRVFAERLGVKAKDLIRTLIRQGSMATINQVLEPEVAQKLAEDLGIETIVVTFEEEIQRQEELTQDANAENLLPRPPVITIMGHVDHGKTSLLDKIRSSRITEGEAGGITQHIAAYRVDVKGQQIVFLDTPGHEAFTKLRARGAQVTDIVILVVAADDGVMAQTQEAIDHARGAKVPIVVAINKIDKPNANQDRVKQELSDRGLVVEEWGGDIVSVPISALKGDGVDTLLDMLLLSAELLDLKADPTLPGQGVVIEARKEKGRGNIATVLVQSGTIRKGDICVAGAAWGKVRAMTDDHGQLVKEAGPSTPVEITGFGDLPGAGDTVQVVDHESKARSIANFRREEARQRELAPTHGSLSLEELFSRIEEGSAEELPIVLKADVQGSLEVLKDTLTDLSTPKVRVNIILSGVGGITTNDISLATASGAIVLGFNVRPEKAATDLARQEGVEVRLYTVIYDILDELEKAMTGLLKPTFQDVDLGRAEVRETFKVPRIGTIAGCHVVEGTIPRTAMARLVRDSVVVYEGKISSLRRFKDDASEVRNGFDCGIGLERFQDVKPGDFIEVYERQEVAATL